MKALYDQICQEYDITRQADPQISQKLMELMDIRAEGNYLDLSCGTGNYTVALNKRGGRWIGIDISSRMLEKAKEKSRYIRWIKADACRLPFKDGKVIGVLCTLAVHHFHELNSVFIEVHRILAQGNFIIFTSLKEQMRKYWLNDYFPDAMEKSIKQMPSMRLLSETFSRAGFRIESQEAFTITRDLKDLFLYSGKYKPDMYLSKRVRDGISTFSNLTSPGELTKGLSRLSRDIQSGRIHQIIEKYENPLGDYLFVKARKI